MFGSLGAASGGLLKGRHNSSEVRSAPPLLGPVHFPQKQPDRPPVDRPSWGKSSPPPDLCNRYVGVKKPSDLTPDSLASLNLEITEDVELEELIHDLPRGAELLPPEDWIRSAEKARVSWRQSGTSYAAAATAGQAEQSKSSPRRLLANGQPAPTRDDFVMRLQEVLCDNQDAFCTLSRAPAPDQKPVRLAYLRRFWEGLDSMSYYWDTSLDEYLPSHPDTGQSAVENERGDMNHNGTQDDAQASQNPAATAQSSDREQISTHLNSPQLVKPSDPYYRGNRIGSPPQMPSAFIADTTRGFLEACSWPFGFNTSPPRRPPILALGPLRVPVRLSGSAYQPPKERLRARQGWLEGPVAGWTTRVFEAGLEESPTSSDGSTNGFSAPGGTFTTNTPSESKSMSSFEHASLLDTLREIGVLLCLAQERGREGCIEKLPGEGEWWTSKPRWGGGPGGEVGEGIGASDEVGIKIAAETGGDAAAESSRNESRARDAATLVRSARPLLTRRNKGSRRKASAIEAWKTIKPGSGYWDPRVEYRHVGKEPGSDWDDVFLISTLHTHISVLHLRVHKHYVECITTGKVPSSASSTQDSSSDGSHWSRPRLRRSRWYNFFSRDERIAAFRGLWGLFGVLSYVREDYKSIGVGGEKSAPATSMIT